MPDVADDKAAGRPELSLDGQLSELVNQVEDDSEVLVHTRAAAAIIEQRTWCRLSSNSARASLNSWRASAVFVRSNVPAVFGPWASASSPFRYA